MKSLPDTLRFDTAGIANVDANTLILLGQRFELNVRLHEGATDVAGFTNVDIRNRTGDHRGGHYEAVINGVIIPTAGEGLLCGYYALGMVILALPDQALKKRILDALRPDDAAIIDQWMHLTADNTPGLQAQQRAIGLQLSRYTASPAFQTWLKAHLAAFTDDIERVAEKNQLQRIRDRLDFYTSTESRAQGMDAILALLGKAPEGVQTHFLATMQRTDREPGEKLDALRRLFLAADPDATVQGLLEGIFGVAGSPGMSETAYRAASTLQFDYGYLEHLADRLLSLHAKRGASTEPSASPPSKEEVTAHDDTLSKREAFDAQLKANLAEGGSLLFRQQPLTDVEKAWVTRLLALAIIQHDEGYTLGCCGADGEYHTMPLADVSLLYGLYATPYTTPRDVIKKQLAEMRATWQDRLCSVSEYPGLEGVLSRCLQDGFSLSDQPLTLRGLEHAVLDTKYHPDRVITSQQLIKRFTSEAAWHLRHCDSQRDTLYRYLKPQLLDAVMATTFWGPDSLTPVTLFDYAHSAAFEAVFTEYQPTLSLTDTTKKETPLPALTNAVPDEENNPFIWRGSPEHPGEPWHRAQRDDPTAVLQAVHQNASALLLTDRTRLNDPAFMAQAVAINGLTLAHAPKAMKDDDALVTQAVTQNGRALAFASHRLCQDKRIVLRAAQQNGLALEFAHASLQDDTDVVKAAITQTGTALRFASLACRKDKALVCIAIQQSPEAVRYAVDPFTTAGTDVEYRLSLARALQEQPELQAHLTLEESSSVTGLSKNLFYSAQSILDLRLLVAAGHDPFPSLADDPVDQTPYGLGYKREVIFIRIAELVHSLEDLLEVADLLSLAQWKVLLKCRSDFPGMITTPEALCHARQTLSADHYAAFLTVLPKTVPCTDLLRDLTLEAQFDFLADLYQTDKRWLTTAANYFPSPLALTDFVSYHPLSPPGSNLLLWRALISRAITAVEGTTPLHSMIKETATDTVKKAVSLLDDEQQHTLICAGSSQVPGAMLGELAAIYAKKPRDIRLDGEWSHNDTGGNQAGLPLDLSNDQQDSAQLTNNVVDFLTVLAEHRWDTGSQATTHAMTLRLPVHFIDLTQRVLFDLADALIAAMEAQPRLFEAVMLNNPRGDYGAKKEPDVAAFLERLLAHFVQNPLLVAHTTFLVSDVYFDHEHGVKIATTLATIPYAKEIHLYHHDKSGQHIQSGFRLLETRFTKGQLGLAHYVEPNGGRAPYSVDYVKSYLTAAVHPDHPLPLNGLSNALLQPPRFLEPRQSLTDYLQALMKNPALQKEDHDFTGHTFEASHVELLLTYLQSSHNTERGVLKVYLDHFQEARPLLPSIIGSLSSKERGRLINDLWRRIKKPSDFLSVSRMLPGEVYSDFLKDSRRLAALVSGAAYTDSPKRALFAMMRARGIYVPNDLQVSFFKAGAKDGCSDAELKAAGFKALVFYIQSEYMSSPYQSQPDGRMKMRVFLNSLKKVGQGIPAIDTLPNVLSYTRSSDITYNLALATQSEEGRPPLENNLVYVSFNGDELRCEWLDANGECFVKKIPWSSFQEKGCSDTLKPTRDELAQFEPLKDVLFSLIKDLNNQRFYVIELSKVESEAVLTLLCDDRQNTQQMMRALREGDQRVFTQFSQQYNDGFGYDYVSYLVATVNSHLQSTFAGEFFNSELSTLFQVARAMFRTETNGRPEAVMKALAQAEQQAQAQKEASFLEDLQRLPAPKKALLFEAVTAIHHKCTLDSTAIKDSLQDCYPLESIERLHPERVNRLESLFRQAFASDEFNLPERMYRHFMQRLAAYLPKNSIHEKKESANLTYAFHCVPRGVSSSLAKGAALVHSNHYERATAFREDLQQTWESADYPSPAEKHDAMKKKVKAQLAWWHKGVALHDSSKKAHEQPLKAKIYDEFFDILAGFDLEITHEFFTHLLLNNEKLTDDDKRAFEAFRAQHSREEQRLFKATFFEALIEKNGFKNTVEQESEEDTAKLTRLLQAYLIADTKLFKALPQTLQESLWENKSVLCAELVGILVLLQPHLAAAGGAAFIVKKLIGLNEQGVLSPEDSPLKALTKAGSLSDETQEVDFLRIGESIMHCKRQVGLTITEDRIETINHAIPNAMVGEPPGLVVDWLTTQIHRQVAHAAASFTRLEKLVIAVHLRECLEAGYFTTTPANDITAFIRNASFLSVMAAFSDFNASSPLGFLLSLWSAVKKFDKNHPSAFYASVKGALSALITPAPQKDFTLTNRRMKARVEIEKGVYQEMVWCWAEHSVFSVPPQKDATIRTKPFTIKVGKTDPNTPISEAAEWEVAYLQALLEEKELADIIPGVRATLTVGDVWLRDKTNDDEKLSSFKELKESSAVKKIEPLPGQAKYSKLQVQLSQLTQHTSQNTTQIAQLQRDFETFRVEVKKLQETAPVTDQHLINDILSRIQALESQIGQLTVNGDQNDQGQMQGLSTELEDLKNQMEEQKKQLDAVVENAAKEKKKAQERMGNLERDLAKAESVAAEAKSEAAQTKTEVQKLLSIVKKHVPTACDDVDQLVSELNPNFFFARLSGFSNTIEAQGETPSDRETAQVGTSP